MRKILSILTLIVMVSAASPALAQGLIAPGHVLGNGTSATRTPTDSALSSVFDQAFCATNGQTVSRSAGTWGCSAAGAPTSRLINTTAPLAGGGDLTADRTLSITGLAGGVLAGAGPAFTATPTLGASGTLGSLTFGNATSGLLTLQAVTGALGTVTVSLPAATDTLVGKATTDTLTNKTLDTAGTGNVFKINGTQITAVTGTGAAVLATSPTLVTPTLGVASATTINKVTLTAPATGSTLTIADGKTLTASNTLTFNGTDSTTFTLPTLTDTLVGIAASQTLTNKTLTAPTINGGSATALTGLAIRSSGSAFDLTFANTEVLTAGRTLTITVNNAARNLNLSGDLTTAAAFTTAGANALTLTTTGPTNITLPTSGTLAVLGSNQTFSGQNIFSAVQQFSDIKLSSGHIYPTSDGTTALQITKADGITRVVDFDTTNARVGINKTPGAFDLDVNGALNVGTTLTFTTLDSASLANSPSTITGLTINNSPNSTLDYIPYFDHTANKWARCTVGSCAAAATAGVSSLNGLTGGLSLSAGSGITFSSASTTITATVPPIMPQGRLTLVTATPVMTSTQTAKTTIFYDCTQGGPGGGQYVPVYNGSISVPLLINACEISMGLDAVTPHIASGSVYDVVAISNAGALALCAGPAWTSTTNRGTGAGTAQIDWTTTGYGTNAVSLTHCWGGASGTTDYGPISANRGTLLGTFQASANGQTQCLFGTSGATWGTAASCLLVNVYNQVLLTLAFGNTTTSYTYNTATIRQAHGSPAAQATIIDPIGSNFVHATYANSVSPGNAGGYVAGIGVGSTTTFSGFRYAMSAAGANVANLSVYDGVPGVGVRTISANEWGGGGAGTNTVYGAGGLGAGLDASGLTVNFWQ